MITGESRFIQLAGEKMDAGSRKEEEEDWQGAYDEYSKAIDFFLAAKDATKIPGNAQIYVQKATECIRRSEKSEKIKKILESKSSNVERNDTLKSAIIVKKPNVKWDDVAGLQNAKEVLRENLILPLQFPELFISKRKPSKGIFFFGPPGTGKSFLVKALSTDLFSECTFFWISYSDVMSKWVGHWDELIKQLFILAHEKRPSIIFLNKIDIIAGKRNDPDIVRSKGEIVKQMEQFFDRGEHVVAATNAPWDVDPAVTHKFEKKIYIPLPDFAAREAMFKIHLGITPHEIVPDGFRYLAANSDGYSGADIEAVVREAVMRPLHRLQNTKVFRQVDVRDPKTGKIVSRKYTPCEEKDPQAKMMSLIDIKSGDLLPPPVTLNDVMSSLSSKRPSVSKEVVARYIEWMKEVGLK